MHNRFGIRLVTAGVVSFITQHFLGETPCFLMPLSTLYVMQTTPGSAFYQGIQKLVIILIIIALCSAPLQSFSFFYNMAHDASLGAAIGILANLIFFPEKPDRRFREEMVPVIKTLNAYFSQLIDPLLQHDENTSTNRMLENALLNAPNWVYERGFTSALQTGYRFFLSNVEQMADVLFSLHQLTRHPFDKELIAKIRPALLNVVDSINQFFEAGVRVLQLKKISDEPNDLENRMAELQKQLFTIVPPDLDLLDMREDTIKLTALFYQLEALQVLLLKMGEAFR
ncbi:MAG TPA: hypothetical protein VLJ15_05605 [Gammaproteobacteria bacterium]|nr:hypothetical protein [Gammaproteobacteria bacterium]